MSDEIANTFGPFVFLASVGTGALLAYKYNPAVKSAADRDLGGFLADALTSNWVRGTFALGALTRLIFFNIRDELVLTLSQSPGREKDLERKPLVTKGKPLFISGLMNFAACIVTPVNAIYFCTWSAGWETANLLYTVFWAPSK